MTHPRSTRVARRIFALIVAAILGGAATAAPQTPAPETQLDRIEHKLDLILRKLDQLQPGRAAGSPPGQGPATANQATPPAGGVSPSPAPESMAAGAVAILHPAPKTDVAAHTIPADSIGGFVYSGGSIHLADLKDRGIHYAGLAGVEWQGWLRATETGRYELELDGSAVSHGYFTSPACIFTGWLEGRSIGTQEATPRAGPARPASFSLILGATLQPGLYKLRLWATCTPSAPDQQVSIALMEKPPSELNPRPVTGDDIVHKSAADHTAAPSR